jgi:hypothetical protein
MITPNVFLNAQRGCASTCALHAHKGACCALYMLPYSTCSTTCEKRYTYIVILLWWAGGVARPPAIPSPPFLFESKLAHLQIHHMLYMIDFQILYAHVVCQSKA